jgi:glycolate oxidase FAD binding subunit
LTAALSLPTFYTDNDDMSIGAVYANGAQDISDSVLGVQIINGTGVLLNFGGQVIKNSVNTLYMLQ